MDNNSLENEISSNFSYPVLDRDNKASIQSWLSLIVCLSLTGDGDIHFWTFDKANIDNIQVRLSTLDVTSKYSTSIKFRFSLSSRFRQ